mmetsp:Transcript_44832/g.51806  ORF Transcript_44832/g.51806 Transcript_44832/m.51806 type:complete len:213 (-) Transcript_44832:734-1372(-)
MSNVFKRVVDWVSEIVHWVDAPFVSDMWMRSVLDSVSNRISHSSVLVLHVEFESEHSLTFLIHTHSHSIEELEVFFNGSVSPRTVELLVSVLFHFSLSLMADISISLLDELNSTVVEVLEIVRSIGDFERLVAQPVAVFLDAINVLDTFFLRVSVIKSQIGVSAVFRSQSEVESHSFSMTDVNVTIWLWRESGKDLSAGCLQMLLQDFRRVD